MYILILILSMCHHCSSVVGCQVAIGDMAPAFRVRKGKREGRGGTLTLINMNSDDMCHHCLDDMARARLSPSVIIVRLLGW